jgi:hypothetical protein
MRWVAGGTCGAVRLPISTMRRHPARLQHRDRQPLGRLHVQPPWRHRRFGAAERADPQQARDAPARSRQPWTPAVACHR